MKRHIDKIEGAHYERGYVYNFHYHLVWVTKYRHAIFTTPELINEMKTLLYTIADQNEIKIDAMEVMADHVHLMIEFKPKLAATTVVKAFKGVSAKRFFERHPDIKHDRFWGGHLWSNSYFMSTVGDMSKETVKKYILNQYHK